MTWLPLVLHLPPGAGSWAESVSLDKKGVVDEEDSVRVRFLSALSQPNAGIFPNSSTQG